MKYNLSNIMSKANSYRKTIGKSLALRKAWAEEKLANIDRAFDEAMHEAPAVWMPIREARFAARDALAAINAEAEAAAPVEAMKNKLFVLKMADRPSADECEEINRLEWLLAA